MKYLVEMWKRIFDYKGKSGRKEFWIPFAINSALAFVDFLLICAAALTEFSLLAIPIVIISLYLAVSGIPFIALTVRRLHDTGRSGWWYCLVFCFGIGAIILLFMCAVVIVPFIASENIEEAVYGPPEYFENYDPSENIEADVYGPPEYFEEETEPEETELTEETTLAETTLAETTTAVITTTAAVTSVVTELPETSVSTEEITETEPILTSSENEEPEDYDSSEWLDDYDPYENIEEDVYGPPEWFDEYDPYENMEEAVYGPPEWFE